MLCREMIANFIWRKFDSRIETWKCDRALVSPIASSVHSALFGDDFDHSSPNKQDFC
jgi:hypothetical protein